MKILNYTFVKEKWKTNENGELVLDDKNNPIIESKKYPATFCLLTAGLKEFEILTGETLLSAFAEVLGDDDFIDEKINIKQVLSNFDMHMIGALASVSFLDPSSPNNIAVSSKKFMESEMFECAITDTEFFTKLVTMVIECLGKSDHKKSNKKDKNQNKNQNKNQKK